MSMVSVIIPIYNVEPYIERCTRSLMEQTLDDVEFIFVNDATPDSSMEVLHKTLADYPQRLKFVKIIEHEFNKGLPTARQTGLAVATGDYIIHCDSDDYVDCDMYRLMYEKAVGNNYDIVVADYYRVKGEWKERRYSCDPYDVDLIKSATLLCSGFLWNKMIKRSIAIDDSVRFPVMNMGEDIPLVVQYYLLSKSVGYIDQPLYYYVVRSSSILGKTDSTAMLQKLDQFVVNFDIAVESIRNHGKYDEYKDVILHECLYIKNMILPVMAIVPCYSKWKDTYSEINRKVLFSRMFTLREKLNFVITYLGLYPIYYKLTHYNA